MPACGFDPPMLNSFRSYAPDLANGGSGFKSNYFSNLARLEDQNFWFKARNQLIIWAINKYCNNFQSFLEIGCGTGYVLSGVSKKFPGASLVGSDIFTEGLDFATSRLPSADLIQMDARNIPYREEFDIIGAFDVLEHINEDELVLSEVRMALKMNGLFLITVPQHHWLWSSADVYACHVRRYSATELHKKLVNAGFEVLRSTSFVSLLLPAMLLSRLFKQQTVSNFDPTAELKLPASLNSFFYQVMQSEISMINQRINLPIGGSRLVIARRAV